MMNYRTVLRDFSPIEWGDFLMRFEINQRSYVLFSPEHGKVSCLELMYFTELDPLRSPCCWVSKWNRNRWMSSSSGPPVPGIG